jgi:CheY-like chemotaxis protein
LERFVAPLELAGLRVLVVEDDALVSLAIENLLEDLRCQVVGSYADLAAALDVAQKGDFDFGLLDINLRGATSFSIGDVLTTRKKPFILISGSGKEAVPSDRAGWPVCGKPFHEEDLARMMVEALRQKQEPATAPAA